MKLDKKSQKIVNELDKLSKADFSFSSGHILGSMCTQPFPIAKEAYERFLETNIGDYEIFPGTQKIEKKYIEFISRLLNAPKNSAGLVVSGGTEANITAMWLAKLTSGKKEIIIPEGAHFSFRKIASLMDMRLITIPLNDDFIADVNAIKKKISSNTAAVLAIAGSTELGMIDPIPEISDICYDKNIFLHVDAAFGGYAIPFLKELQYKISDFDFRLKGVSTISIDAHKMGCSAIPMGTIMIRQHNWLDKISGEPNCTSSRRQSGILGTRSGGPVAAAYAVAKYLGYEGYSEVVKCCMDVTNYTIKQVENIGLELVTKPKMNVLGIKLKKPEKVVNSLSSLGWRVNKIDRLSAIRIVLMPHVKREHIDKFIPILDKICQDLGEI